MAAVPLMQALGFEPRILASPADGGFVLSALGDAASAARAVRRPHGRSRSMRPGALATRAVVETGRSWCFSTNGRQVRLLDVRRRRAMDSFEFDLTLRWTTTARSPRCGDCSTATASNPRARRTRRSRIFAPHRRVCRFLAVRRARGDRRAALRLRRRPHAGDGRHRDLAERASRTGATVVCTGFSSFYSTNRETVPLWHPSISRELLHRSAPRPGRTARTGARPLSAPSHLPAGARRMSRRDTPGHAVQWPPVRPGRHPAGRERPGERRGGAARAVGAVGRLRRPGGSGVRIAYATLAWSNWAPCTRARLDYRPCLVSAPARAGAAPLTAQPRARSPSGSAWESGSSLERREEKPSGTVLQRPDRSRRTWCGRPWRARAGHRPTRFSSLRIVDPAMGRARSWSRHPIPGGRVRSAVIAAGRVPPERHLGIGPQSLPPSGG